MWFCAGNNKQFRKMWPFGVSMFPSCIQLLGCEQMFSSPVLTSGGLFWNRAVPVLLRQCPSISKVLHVWIRLDSENGEVLYWGSLSNDQFFEGTVQYIGLCVCVGVLTWAAHEHMHTRRSKTGPQSRFHPLVSAHKASPWQLRQKKSPDIKTKLFFLVRLICFFA